LYISFRGEMKNICCLQTAAQECPNYGQCH
jgi:hypothetical protein